MNKKITIIHVFVDGIIFSEMADRYDSMENVENLYYIYSPQKDYALQFIKDERVKIINDKDEYVSFFHNPNIDVVIFYSLPFEYYYLFDYIDDNKYVVWWAWGYDMYYKQGGNEPLLPMKEMYMPLTKEYMAKQRKKLAKLKHPFLLLYHVVRSFTRRLVKTNCSYPKPHKSQKEILARIDSFYAPLDIEYGLMKEKQESFIAKRCPRVLTWNNLPFSFKERPGNILINHSLTYTDNHLDVFHYLRNVEIEVNRKYIIPVSYGIDGYGGNPNNLKDESKMDDSQTIWLTEVLPLNDYNDIISTASHAIYGTLRQQALGNIFRCLMRGVKIYLFEDSIVYKELKNNGYIVFTIEKDLNTQSLSVCLSEKEARINYDLCKQWYTSNSPANFRMFIEQELENKRIRNC